MHRLLKATGKKRKKRSSTFVRKKVHPRQNSGYTPMTSWPSSEEMKDYECWLAWHKLLMRLDL